MKEEILLVLGLLWLILGVALTIFCPDQASAAALLLTAIIYNCHVLTKMKAGTERSTLSRYD